MGAQGSQGSISIRPEVELGVLDPGQFTGVNFVSEDFKFNISKKESKTVRPDRQTANVIPDNADASGMIDTEFQALNMDWSLPAALWDTDWHRVDGASDTGKITAGPTASNLSFSFAIEASSGAGGKLTFGSAVVHAIRKGQHIVVSNPDGNVANRGLMRVKEVSGQIITVNKPLFTEVVQSVAYITGDTIRNGVTMNSFSIERGHHDISQFFLYLGQVPSVMKLTVDSGAVMFSLSFIGLDEQTAQITFSNPAPTSLVLTPIMNTAVSVGEVAVNDVVLTSCLLQKLDITFDNKAEGKKGIGSLGPCNITGKSISVTGGITLYFNDLVEYLKYRNSTYFSLSIPMSDTLGNIYTVYMPKVQYMTSAPNISDKDKDVDLVGTFQAIVGDEGFTLQITRALESGIAFNDVTI